jgi:hypothetical protein
MTTPNTAKITQLIDLFPPETTIGTVVLLSGQPSSTTESISNWLTYEISNYQGTGGRKSAVSPSSASYVIDTNGSGNYVAKCVVPVVFNNASGSGAVVFLHAALFKTDMSELIGLANLGYVDDTYIYAGEAKQINFTLRLR